MNRRAVEGEDEDDDKEDEDKDEGGKWHIEKLNVS